MKIYKVLDGMGNLKSSCKETFHSSKNIFSFTTSIHLIYNDPQTLAQRIFFIFLDR